MNFVDVIRVKNWSLRGVCLLENCSNRNSHSDNNKMPVHTRARTHTHTHKRAHTHARIQINHTQLLDVITFSENKL